MLHNKWLEFDDIWYATISDEYVNPCLVLLNCYIPIFKISEWMERRTEERTDRQCHFNIPLLTSSAGDN